ncbi:MAG: DNA repair protein RecO [Patescibacteria group bacterium]
MLYLKDEGIIITKKPYKEKDSIVIILTKKYGKVRALATGLRKQESRLLGLSEPGTIAKFYFAVSSGKSIVSSNIIRLLSILGWKFPGKGFKENPYLFLWALRFLGTANILEISDELWDIILNLDRAILKDPRGFQVWFVLKVLEELGEVPNFEFCAKCGVALCDKIPLGNRSKNFIAKPNDIFFYNANLYCSKCRKPSYESISQKDLFLIKRLIESQEPIFPYPKQLHKILTKQLLRHGVA